MKNIKGMLLVIIIFISSYMYPQTWFNEQYASPAYLSISAVDANTYWAGGQGTFMIRTTDGGSFYWWHNFGGWESISSIHAISDTEAWILITEGKLEVIKITDEWNTEIKYSEYGESATYGNGVYFWDENTGIVVGDPRTGSDKPFIIRTVDGGNSWSELTNIPSVPSGTYGYTSNYCAVGDNFWFGITGADSTVVHPVIYSGDRGETWSAINPPENFGGVSQVSFISATQGIIDGGGKMARTSDGGNTWEVLRNYFSSVEYNPHNGYLYGSYTYPSENIYQIVRSTDNGSTWEFFENPSGRWLTDFEFPDANTVLAVGDNQALVIGNGTDSPTSVAGPKEDYAPAKFKLYQNYPNPFNPVTTIRYNLEKDSNVILEVYNMLGEKVSLVDEGLKQAGSYSIKFDSSNLASGTYVYRLKSGNNYISKKMVLIK